MRRPTRMILADNLLFPTERQIVRIDADAVAANKSKFEISKFAREAFDVPIKQDSSSAKRFFTNLK